MGSDRTRAPNLPGFPDFNPRSPDGERRCPTRSPWYWTKFQSTLPGWGATLPDTFTVVLDEISIHAPRMGSDRRFGQTPGSHVQISIHAPRMGSDSKTVNPVNSANVFQSTLPGWGATSCSMLMVLLLLISIHAPRMGSDRGAAARSARVRADFNPRSPDGERPRKWTSSPTIWAKSSIFNTDCIADRR